MSLLSKFRINTNRKKLQREVNRNRVILKTARTLGFPTANIRKALIVLNGVTFAEMVSGETTLSNLSRVTRGTQPHPASRRIIAARLGLDVEDLWGADNVV